MKNKIDTSEIQQLHLNVLAEEMKKFELNNLKGRITPHLLKSCLKKNETALKSGLPKEIYLANLNILADANPSNLAEEENRDLVHKRRGEIREKIRELMIKPEDHSENDAVISAISARYAASGGASILVNQLGHASLKLVLSGDDSENLKNQINHLRVAAAAGNPKAEDLLRELIKNAVSVTNQKTAHEVVSEPDDVAEIIENYYRAKQGFSDATEVSPGFLLDTYIAYRAVYQTIHGTREQFEEDLFEVLNSKPMNEPNLVKMAQEINIDSVKCIAEKEKNLVLNETMTGFLDEKSEISANGSQSDYNASYNSKQSYRA